MAKAVKSAKVLTKQASPKKVSLKKVAAAKPKPGKRGPRATPRPAHPLVARFMDMIAAERGAAENTLQAYGRDLADYCAFLATRGGDPIGADSSVARAYLAALDQRGLAPASAARKLSSMRQLHRFLFLEGLRGDDPTLVLDAPRQGRRIPKTLGVDDVSRLLEVSAEGIDDEWRPRGERVRAARTACLLETLYATGLRVSELVALPRRAASTRDPLITIKGKGGRERLVPLSDPRASGDAAIPRVA